VVHTATVDETLPLPESDLQDNSPTTYFPLVTVSPTSNEALLGEFFSQAVLGNSFSGMLNVPVTDHSSTMLWPQQTLASSSMQNNNNFNNPPLMPPQMMMQPQLFPNMVFGGTSLYPHMTILAAPRAHILTAQKHLADQAISNGTGGLFI
jgi:hypothetical protein